jgi:hypothetical protein
MLLRRQKIGSVERSRVESRPRAGATDFDNRRVEPL